MGIAPCYYFLHQITFPCAWEVCPELQVSAVNNRLISGVAGQTAMFASKPSKTEAAPRAVSFRYRTPFSRAAPRSWLILIRIYWIYCLGCYRRGTKESILCTHQLFFFFFMWSWCQVEYHRSMKSTKFLSLTLEEQHHNFKRWGSQGRPPKGCSKVSPVQLGSASPAWQV